jgi:hypothetical protein
MKHKPIRDWPHIRWFIADCGLEVTTQSLSDCAAFFSDVGYEIDHNPRHVPVIPTTVSYETIDDSGFYAADDNKPNIIQVWEAHIKNDNGFKEFRYIPVQAW